VPQKIQRSFTAGELSPSVQSRADITKYSAGLNLCENMFVRAQGGVYSRPGTRFVGGLKDQSKKGRLIPFSYNTAQTYMLVFEENLIRVVKNGEFVLKAAATITNITQANPAVVTTSAHTFLNGESVTITGVVGMTEVNGNTYVIANVTATTFELQGVDSTAFTAYTSGGSAQSDAIYEVVTTYTEAQLPRLGYTQSADTMTIVHPDHDPANLTRAADADWTLSTISYAPTVTAPTISSLTAGGTGAGTYNKTYTYVVTAVDADGVESLASASSSITTPSLSTTAYVRIAWAAIPGADYYRIYKDPSTGTGVYGWIGESTALAFDDFNFAPITSDAPPQDRQPFNGVGNKPSAVNYYQQRQVFANTTNDPQKLFTTQTAIFDSLRASSPLRDDDAITFTIAAQQVNEIRHIISLDTLILMTSGGEWAVSEGQDRVLTPSTIGVRIQSYNGSSWVKPVVINSTALYLQEKGARIRDLGYDELTTGKYVGTDLSLLAEHLFNGYEITDMAYADEPYGILWCIRNDGVMLGLTYQREHQVSGWHRHTTNGEFEAVSTVTEGNRDAPYFIVKRTIGGQTKRYVERLDPRESINAVDAFYVDSGITYNGTATVTITGLDHLEGEAVAVLSDGNEVIGKIVSSGSITLDRAASKVHVGLAYIPAVELLDIDIASANETVKAQEVSVSKVVIEVESTRGGFVGARQDLNSGTTITYQEIKPRFDSDGYDSIALKTYKQEVHVDPSWNKGGGLRIEQRSPLPMAILSVIPRVDIGGS